MFSNTKHSTQRNTVAGADQLQRFPFRDYAKIENTLIGVGRWRHSGPLVVADAFQRHAEDERQSERNDRVLTDKLKKTHLFTYLHKDSLLEFLRLHRTSTPYPRKPDTV